MRHTAQCSSKERSREVGSSCEYHWHPICSWKYHRSSLLKSNDMCKESTACILFICQELLMVGQSKQAFQKSCFQFSRAPYNWCLLLLKCELPVSWKELCTNSTLDLWLGTRGMVSVMGWGLQAFLPYPFFLHFCVLICFYFLTHLSPTTSLLNLWPIDIMGEVFISLNHCVLFIRCVCKMTPKWVALLEFFLLKLSQIIPSSVFSLPFISLKHLKLLCT